MSTAQITCQVAARLDLATSRVCRFSGSNLIAIQDDCINAIHLHHAPDWLCQAFIDHGAKEEFFYEETSHETNP